MKIYSVSAFTMNGDNTVTLSPDKLPKVLEAIDDLKLGKSPDGESFIGNVYNEDGIGIGLVSWSTIYPLVASKHLDNIVIRTDVVTDYGYDYVHWSLNGESYFDKPGSPFNIDKFGESR